MRKFVYLAAACAAVLSLASCGNGKKTSKDAGDAAAKSLEISFDYSKKDGGGSNQWAVWIENGQKQVVRTLFVTEFSAKGRSRNGETPERGYRFRTTCVPDWVKDVNADSLTDEQLDAFTGATPAESGLQTYVWDFKDQNGNAVPEGDYKFYVQATFSGTAIVTFSGDVSASSEGELAYETKFDIPDPEGEGERLEERKDMITSLKAVVK